LQLVEHGGGGFGLPAALEFVFSVLLPALDEDLFEGFFVRLALVFGGRGQDAVGLVVDELVDGFGGAGRVDGFDGLGFGQGGEGDLEAVEEEAGAFGVDGVAGDAVEDVAEGELDGGAVFEVGEDEGGLVLAAGWEVLDGAAGGVVVVAEIFMFEGGRAAAEAGGEDMAAAHALAGGLDGSHGGLLLCLF
jgi:hypothetical protein